MSEQFVVLFGKDDIDYVCAFGPFTKEVADRLLSALPADTDDDSWRVTKLSRSKQGMVELSESMFADIPELKVALDAIDIE